MSAFGSGLLTVFEPAFAVEDADPEWDFGFPHQVLDLLRKLDDWCLALWKEVGALCQPPS